MKKALVLSLATLFVIGGMSWFVSPAKALPQFKKAFQARYVTPSTSAEFKAAFKAASCNTCHVKHKEKKVRNDYGMALSKIIGGHAHADLKAAEDKGPEAKKAEMAKILKKLDEAFTKVEQEKSPSGPTYGELIKSGKLP